MDTLELAFDQENNRITEAVRKVRAAKGPRLIPTGSCYYCESDVNKNQLFCDGECAKDYDNEQKLNKGRY